MAYCMAAMQELKEDRIPDDSALPSFTELQRVIGFPEYFQEAERYAAAPQPEAPAVAAAGNGGSGDLRRRGACLQAVVFA